MARQQIYVAQLEQRERDGTINLDEAQILWRIRARQEITQHGRIYRSG